MLAIILPAASIAANSTQEGAGFLVDDDEDDDVEDRAARRKRKREKRKIRDVEEDLDEDDLDIIGERPEPEEQPQVWNSAALHASTL